MKDLGENFEVGAVPRSPKSAMASGAPEVA